jgi:hypothetical protein
LAIGGVGSGVAGVAGCCAKAGRWQQERKRNLSLLRFTARGRALRLRRERQIAGLREGEDAGEQDAAG